MKKKKELIFEIILGLLIFGTAGVLAYNYNANQISYTTNKNGSVENVEQAINDLYGKVRTGPTKENAPSGATYKGIVYMDPTDLTKTCNQNNSVSLTGTKTGCMKWYIYNDTGDYYTMILDHNTTDKHAWSKSTNSNVLYENSEVKPVVDDLVSTSKWIITPRLISADEISNITNNSNFDKNSVNSYYYFNDSNNGKSAVLMDIGTSKYAWLFNYTMNCTDYGCNVADSSTKGYWTSTSAGEPTKGLYMWIVCYNGAFSYHPASWDTEVGIRPVVTISKSIITK